MTGASKLEMWLAPSCLRFLILAEVCIDSYEELEEEKREMRCIYKTRGDVKVYLEPCKTILDWPKSGKQGGDIK